jgi:hypothetical protein
MDKHYNENGDIGLIVSSGFGAGWSSWASNELKDFMLMDRTLVEMCLNKASESEAEDYITKVHNLDYVCTLGWDDAYVTFLPPNTPFYLHEYDGSEHIVTEFNNTGE